MRKTCLLLLAVILVTGCEPGTKKDVAKNVNGKSAVGNRGSVGTGQPIPLTSVGQMAPEISGADLDGVEFNLSDYRGKVVMLDFWGDW